MGQSSSSSSSGGRPRRDEYYQQTPPPQATLTPPPARPALPLPPPPQPQIASTSYPPPPQPYYNASYYQQLCGYPNPNPNPPRYYGQYSGQPPYNHYYAPSPSYWAPMAPPPVGPVVAPPPFVERESTKKIKNDVNLHKHTIKLVPDDQNPDQYLVSFVFDASVDGSVTIYYFAKDESNCSFSSAIPGIGTSTSVPFQKGTAQKFIQPPGSGIDLGFFPLDELSKPSDGVFPLVIYADATPKSIAQSEQLQRASTHAQITLAVIERSNEGAFVVKVVKQILWIDQVKYELQEIFGLVSSPEPEVKNIEDDDLGKDCVICLSEPRDTAVLPCRHMVSMLNSMFSSSISVQV